MEDLTEIKVSLARLIQNQEHVKEMLAMYLKTFEKHVEDDKQVALSVQRIERKMTYWQGGLAACTLVFAFVAQFVTKKLFNA